MEVSHKELQNKYEVYLGVEDSSPALSTRDKLACACARSTGSPQTVEHRYLPGFGRYATLIMRAKE